MLQNKPMKARSWLLALALYCITFNSLAQDAEEKTILMVVSGYGAKQGEERPGFEFDELAKAYLTFRDAGIKVDIASPQGGTVEADKYDPTKSYNKAFSDDSKAMEKLNSTLSLDTVKAEIYNGIFIVGGKGAMFDLPANKVLQKTIADIYQNNGTVGAVCHGPAALVNVKLSNGEFLVAGRKVNGFTNTEEQLFGKKWVKKFDFLLEDKLKQRGAKFEYSPMMLSHVATDDRLITGQNPTSTVDTARAIIKSFGLKPAKGNNYQDDITLKLVAKILDGNTQAVTAYKDNKESYQTPLIGMYGFYQLEAAKDEKTIKDSVYLMELAQTEMNHPMLGLQIAKGYQQLNDTEKAKQVLSKLIEANPKFKQAKQLLQSL